MGHLKVLCDVLIKKAGSILFFLFFTCQLLYGQSKTAPEYQVKAVFLYNFTQFIEWSSSAFSSDTDPFVIGIIGDDPFGSFLDETVAGEKYGTHPIQVQRYQDVKDINSCHILYINSDDVELTNKILEDISHKNILTVSDASNFSRLNGMVRFFTEGNKIRFQINVELSKGAQLNISSKLLNVAKTN